MTTGSITVLGICPRIDPSDPDLLPKIDQVNRELAIKCSDADSCAVFVDNDPQFRLRNGSVDSSLLLRDGVHLTFTGCDKLLESAKLTNYCYTKRKTRIPNPSTRHFDNRGRRNQINRAIRQPAVRCYYCGESGHIQRVCRHGTPVQCWTCGDWGHKAQLCNYPRRQH